MEIANNAEDTAQLQFLKTLDSVDAKLNILKTTVQEFYTESGVQDVYKGIITFATTVIGNLTEMKRHIGTLPIEAAAAILRILPLIKVVGTFLIKILITAWQGYTKSITSEAPINGRNWAQQFTDGAWPKIKEFFQRMKQESRQAGQDAGREMGAGINSNTKAQTAQNWGTGIAAIGTAVALSTSNNTVSGLGNIVGAVGSGLGAVVSGIMHNWPAVIIQAVSAISGLIAGMEDFSLSAEEKLQKLKDEAEELSNTALISKDEYKTLDDYLKDFKELSKHKYENDESLTKYNDLVGEIVDKYPDLISNINSEGEAVIDLTYAYSKLYQAQLKAAQDHANAAASTAATSEEELKQSKDQVSKDEKAKPYEFEAHGSTVLPYQQTLESVTYQDAVAPIVKALLSDDNRSLFKKKTTKYLKALLNENYSTLLQEYSDIETVLSKEVKRLSSNEDSSSKNAILLLNELLGNVDPNEQSNEYRTVKGKFLPDDSEYSSIAEDFYKDLNLQHDTLKKDTNNISQKASMTLANQRASIFSENSRKLIENNAFDLIKITNFESIFNSILGEKFNPYKYEHVADFLESQTYNDTFDALYTVLFNLSNDLSPDELEKLNQILNKPDIFSINSFSDAISDVISSSTIENPEATIEYFNTFFNETYGNYLERVKNQLNTLKNINFDDNLLNEIPILYLQSVGEQLTSVNEQIDKDLLNQNAAEAYNNIIKQILDQTDEQIRNQALAALLNSDLTSYIGLDALIDTFQQLGLQPDNINEYKEQFNKESINWELQAAAYFDTLNGSLKDYEDALEKASKGMSFEDAYKLSQQMGITLESFKFVDGKWYFKELAEVTKALYKKNAEIEEKIQDQGDVALEALKQETDYVERQAKLAVQVQQASDPIEAATLELLSKAMEITDQEIADYLLAIGSDWSISTFKGVARYTDLGNGKYQLNNLSFLPQYNSKSAQEIEENLIDQRIKQVEEIDNKFLDLITNISKSTGMTQLNAKFLEYSGVDIAAIANAVGAEYENGILTLTSETDLAALVTQLAATDGAQNIADQIADTVFEAFSTYLDLIRDALEGSLNATGRTSLKGKYGLSDDDFIYGAKGYKLNESGLAKTYSQLSYNEQADIIKDIYDDLQDNNSELNDSYELIQKIKQLENDIHHSSSERTEELKKQRDLYADILKYQSFNDPDAFDLTKGKLGNQEQSALNTYESAIKLLSEFGKNKEGTVSVEAFHSFVNLLYGTNEEAAKKLFGGSEDVATAADVLRKSWSYLDNVEGEAVIDLAAWGVPLLDGANSLSEATTEALKVIAKSEIEQLEGLKKYYETLAKLDEMDVEAFSGNIIGENGIISEEFKNYLSPFFWDSIDLFDEFIINGQTGRTLGDALREAVKGTLENEAEINLLQLFFNELITNSEIEWDPNDVTSLKEKIENFLQELCKELGLDFDLKLSKPTLSIEDGNWFDESGHDIRYVRSNGTFLEDDDKVVPWVSAPESESESQEAETVTQEAEIAVAGAVVEAAEAFEEYTEVIKTNADNAPKDDPGNNNGNEAAENLWKLAGEGSKITQAFIKETDHSSQSLADFSEEANLVETTVQTLGLSSVKVTDQFLDDAIKLYNASRSIDDFISKLNSYAFKIKNEDYYAGGKYRRESNQDTGTGGATGNVSLAHGTLMGELGPELVCSNGHYYTVGNNGAEFVNLPDDAIVFNHLQTAGLLSSGRINGHGKAVKGDKKAVGMAHGNAHASASEMVKVIDEMIAAWQSILDLDAQSLASKAKNSGGGGGGGSNDNAGAYTAELERWYNYLQEIDAIEKSISLEEAKRATYTKELSDGGSRYAKSLNESIKKLKQENKILKEFVEDQQTVYNLEMERFTNSKYSSIYAFNKNTGKLMYQDGGLAILSSILEKADDATLGGDPTKIAEQQLQEIYKLGFTAADLRYDAEGNDAGDNIQQMVQNFFDGAEYWKEDLESMFESFTENEEKIANNEAEIQKIQQEKIDNQLELENDIMTAIVDAREKIIEGMQDELEAIEENGQNYIKGLSEALQKERDLYDRSQTEKETATLRNRLAILQRTGGSASEIKSLQDQLDSRAQEAYFQAQQDEIDKVQEALDTQTEQLQKQIDLETEALAFQKENGLLWDQVYDMMNNWPVGEIADFIQANTESLQGNSPTAMAEQLKEEIYKVQIYREEDVKDDKKEDNGSKDGEDKGTTPSSVLPSTPPTPIDNTPKNTQPTDTQTEAKKAAIKQLQELLNQRGFLNNYTPGIYDKETKYALSLLQRMLHITPDGLFGPQTQAAIYKALSVKIPLFKSGGVDNFTGLAMLHGTKSKPEAVLSADDYQLLKSTLLNQKNGTLANAIRSINELAGTFNRAINGKADGTDVIIENVNLTLTSGVIANSYDARDAARTVKDELLKIARKTGNRSY